MKLGLRQATKMQVGNCNSIGLELRGKSAADVTAGQAAQHLQNWPRQVQLCRTPATGWRRINWSGNADVDVDDDDHDDDMTA